MAANEWSERTRMIVTIAVALIGNAALGGGLYYVYGEWQKLDKEHKAKVAEKKVLEDFVKQEDERKVEFKMLTERFKSQESMLPEEDEVAKLMVNISQQAELTKCNMKTFAKGASGVGGDFGSSYTREVWRSRWDGDFMGWCKLMNKLEEEFPRFIAFENLTIQPANSGVVLSGSKHEINVDVITYKYVRPLGN